MSESLPPELGCFDLVIIDEASQSDLTALPSLLRAQKVLIVGDDKQVSPEGVGLEVEKCRSLMSRFLNNHVDIYRSQLDPARSIYDLFKVVFARSSVMLKEHFRCVAPIIEYSKREFYNHELRPLRIPKASERLDPPLIDVSVQDGFRQGDINRAEVRFIVDEIKAIVSDTNMAHRSIGVVSLLADKQARELWDRLTDELGPEAIEQHRITCGDARTFQGKERDIMFLSMVSAPNDVGAPLSRATFEQRFNVAASRAKDRMYLVRSVELDNLSPADRLRRSLIAHFRSPFTQDEQRVEHLRDLCESPFEREVYDELTQRRYLVTPQVRVGQFRIDMVVEGANDARLAIECDGDKYHGAEKWADDMQRQRVLERAGWVFWRCFATTFIRRRNDMVEDLIATLAARGIEPIGAEGSPRSVHTEHRVVNTQVERPTGQESFATVNNSATDHNSGGDAQHIEQNTTGEPMNVQAQKPGTSQWTDDELRSLADRDGENLEFAFAPEEVARCLEIKKSQSLIRTDCDGITPEAYPSNELSAVTLPFSTYVHYSGPPGLDPRSATDTELVDGLVRIIAVEGPVLAKRAFDIYLRSCGINRLGPDLKSTMNKAVYRAARQGRVVCENEADTSGILFSVVRIKDTPPINLRTRGPRTFEQIPLSEVQVVAKYLMRKHEISAGSDEHLRAVLECFDLQRLTTQVGARILDGLERSIPYADEFLAGLRD